MGYSMSAGTEPIVLVGQGAFTSIGKSAPISAASVRARLNRFHQHRFLLDLAGEPLVTAAISSLPEIAPGIERLVGMSLPALQEAMGPLRGVPRQGRTLPVLLGLAPARPGHGRDCPPVLQQRLREARVAEWQPDRFEVLEHGHSAGLMALEQACLRLGRGEWELCLVGGCDTYLPAETLDWLDMQEQLKSPRHRWGFIPGEAAGFCLLASERLARRYGLPMLARVLGASTAVEEKRIKTDTVCTGDGLTQAIRQALQPIAAGTQVDQVICDQNGERYRADEYGFVLTRLSPRLRHPASFIAPADCWGDVGAASGPLLACLAVASGQRGYAAGPLSLLWTSSESGERSAVVLDVTVHQPRC